MIESAEEFVELTKSDDPTVQRRAIGYSAPEHVWLDIVDRYPQMRLWVARNKMVPDTILRILAGDKDDGVRAAVATRVTAKVDTLTLLARDPIPDVRERVARNPKASREMLEELVRDKEDSVSVAARETIERHYEMLWLQMEVAGEDVRAFLACLGLGALHAYRSGVPEAGGGLVGVSRLAMWKRLDEIPELSRELINVLRWAEDLEFLRQTYPRARFEEILAEGIALLEEELRKGGRQSMWVRWLGESRHAPRRPRA